jgi:hypothetical protein
MEVVFGHDSETRNIESRLPVPSPGACVDDLSQRVDRIWNLLARTTAKGPRAHVHRQLVEQALIDAGVTSELAAEIDESVSRGGDRLGAGQHTSADRHARAEPGSI